MTVGGGRGVEMVRMRVRMRVVLDGGAVVAAGAGSRLIQGAGTGRAAVRRTWLTATARSMAHSWRRTERPVLQQQQQQ